MKIGRLIKTPPNPVTVFCTSQLVSVRSITLPARNKICPRVTKTHLMNLFLYLMRTSLILRDWSTMNRILNQYARLIRKAAIKKSSPLLNTLYSLAAAIKLMFPPRVPANTMNLHLGTTFPISSHIYATIMQHADSLISILNNGLKIYWSVEGRVVRVARVKRKAPREKDSRQTSTNVSRLFLPYCAIINFVILFGQQSNSKMSSLQSSASDKMRKFVEAQLISPHLHCSMCMEVFDNPTRTMCGYRHTFCYVCIETWACINKRCPICSKSILRRKLERDLIAFKLIQQLPVRCTNIGCRWRGLNSQMKKHQRRCEMRTKKVVDTSGKQIIEIQQEQ